MHSADPTLGRSVRQTSCGQNGANTLKWGTFSRFGKQMRCRRFPVQQGGAASSDAERVRRRSQYPAVTATGEGRP